MNKEQKMLLASLRMKSAGELTPDEMKKLAELTKLAEKEGIELNKEFDAEFSDKSNDGDDDGMTEKELSDIVSNAVKEATEAGKDDDIEAITKSITEGFKGKTIGAEELETIIKKHITENKIDEDSLVKAMVKAFKDANTAPASDTITKAEAQKMVADAVKESEAKRIKSKMVHPAGDIDVHRPIEHRSGNLSVASKQLLNICLSRAPQDVLDQTGTARPNSMNDGIPKEILAKSIASGQQRVEHARKSALYGSKAPLLTTSAGAGLELIPTDLASELQTRMYAESQLATQLLSTEIDMPTATYKMPLKTTRTSFHTQGEAQDPTQSNIGTDDIVLNASKLTGVASYSYEENEDSIIPILPILQADMAEGATASFEDAIINGHRSATHQDFNIAGIANHHAKLFDGLRRRILSSTLASIKVDLSVGGISETNLLAMKTAMGKYGIKVADLMWVCGADDYNTMLGLDSVLTADKKGGAGATINTGNLPNIFGIPIVYSGAIQSNLDDTGVNVDGGANDKSAIYLVNKRSWIVGVRRSFTVETEIDKFKQLNYVIASLRRDFQPKDDLNTQQLAVMGYKH